AADTFIDELRHRAAQSPPLYGTALCATPTMFSCLDMIRLGLGTLEPFAFEVQRPGAALAAALHAGARPLLAVAVVAAGVPFQFLVHTGDFGHDGEDIPLSHRLAVGFGDGNLIMASLWGPV